MDAQTALKDQKALLRKAALQARGELSQTHRAQAAEALIGHFERALSTHGDCDDAAEVDLLRRAFAADNCVISGFWPIRSEIDPIPLMKKLEARGTNLCLPAVLDASRIEFRSLQFTDKLVEAGFGTYGPVADAKVVDPDILLVPLAAFDSRGHRIGYGAGYYDRAIAQLYAKGRRPVLIGVAYDVQQVDQVPDEAHDIALNYILTESGLRRVTET